MSRCRRWMFRCRRRSSTCCSSCRNGWARLSVRRARPVGGEACQLPRGGDVCRQDRRDRAHRGSVQHPRHPYTEALLSAVPVPDPRRRARRIVLEGDVGGPFRPAARLRLSSALPLCGAAVPPGDTGAGGDRTGALGAVPQGPGAGIAGRAPLLTTSSGESGRQFTENRPAS